ncbi:MAG: extracellular solute-binding protein [Frankiales bacterium]|nr:extracellular solute-binding protein [Frankiales bacterium]
MADLPAGTVTFLFTDIEGSTRLLQQLRDEYARLLSEHERILREAIAAEGGHVVDTQGDAIFAAFPRARVAVGAAIAAQRALAEFPWPQGGTVRVRMGMHTGEPAMRGDRYVGLGVHRAARICSAAHGGQVLLSGATRELVEDELPAGARLVDLGEHRLKDLDRPEHLYQLVVEGLPAEFPPLRTSADDTAPVALAEGGRYFGRRRALAGAAAALIAAGVAAFLLIDGGSSQAAGIAANSVGFIDTHGAKVNAGIPVDAEPTSAAFGPGALWVANSAGGTVSRIDLTTRAVSQTIHVGDSPTGIAVGGGGIWVANHGDGTVSWINPQSNAVVKQIHVGTGPTAVAYGFGSVWVTNADDRTVSRIDVTDGTITATVHTNAVGRGITAGGGSVWVSDEATRAVVQIDPASNTVVSTAGVGTGPVGVAYGDGSVWVANALDGTVSRVDATTLSILATIPVGGGPAAIAFGGGSVWVSAEFGSRVVRIDPAHNRIAASVPVGNRPEGLAAGDGGVWVAVQASGAGHRGGRLVVIGDSLGTIDPALASDTAALALLGAAYDALVSYRRTGGSAGTQLTPDLAAALPLPTDGGKSYRFHLRPGIRYSDGRLLRAVDFRRALERAFTLGNAAYQQGTLPPVVGAAACGPHRPCDLSSGVVVDGPSTLTFHLTVPDPRFLVDVSAIVPVPAGTPLRDIGTKPLPSTGPYEIRTFTRKRLVTLVRNRYFHVWSDARPGGYPDEIVYRVVGDPNNAVRDVLAGRANLLAQVVPAARVPELAARFPRQLHLVPQQATTYVFLNVHRRPFDDIRVRRALNYAVDRKHVVSLHGGVLLAQPTCQVVAPTVPGYRPYCPYTTAPDASGQWKAPDLARARALIDASGTRGERIVVWSFAYFRAESEYFVSLLRQLGYRAHLHYISRISEYFRALEKTPSAQAGFAGWFGSQFAVDFFVTLGCGAAALNQAHYCDPRQDAQVARLLKQEPGDPAGTAALAARVDRAYTDAAPWVPLTTPRFADLTSARTGNFQATPYVAELLEQMWVR